MANSKSNSSLATSRAPFKPATKLEHVPVVFYEILHLATSSGAEEIAGLIRSVIEVTQVDPGSLADLRNLGPEGVRR